MKQNFILVAEDDVDDQLLLKDAFEDNRINTKLHFVSNGIELMNFLKSANQEVYSNSFPNIILLDLNMPKMDGRETLSYLKNHDVYKKIPVIILSTSQSCDDVNFVYSKGGNSFISKTNNYSDMLNLVSNLNEYWFKTVKLV